MKETTLFEYESKNIQTLSARDQVRLRPGMWIGKLGDGSQFDDGEYILLKEILDNSIDEFIIGAGDKIEITIKDNVISTRDYGRGVPFEKLEDCFSAINTSGKYNSESYKKVIGLNGVGAKAANFLSSEFTSTTYRDGYCKSISYKQGVKISEIEGPCTEKNGTAITYKVDEEVFGKYKYNLEFIRKRLHNYVCLNPGLTITLNDEKFYSQNGLIDLLNDREDRGDFLYDSIRLIGPDIECALVHNSDDTEEYTSFVNGQYTSQSGTHQVAFREALAKTLKDFYKGNYESSDFRNGLIGSVKIYVEEPEFESQTKIRLSSKYMSGVTKDVTIRQYILDFVGKELNDYLVKHPNVAKAIEEKAKANMRERKAIAGIKNKSKEQLKKASLNNKKLRDCKIHFTDKKNPLYKDSMIFITEGNSASGSITASRDVRTQAVFSLRGKPLNTFGMKKAEIYKNEEFALLSAALDVENDMENLRYNNVIIATDSDVDGFHIRMLLLTYFVQFFPELIQNGHLYFLITPLFRVRNKKETIYCYDEAERDAAIKKLGKDVEITRYKGLGEANASEFKEFIGPDMKLEQISFGENDKIKETLKFYMGPNTPNRFEYVCENLEDEID